MNAGTGSRAVALLTHVVGDDANARKRLRAAGFEIVIDAPGYAQIEHDTHELERVLGGVEGMIIGLQRIDRRVLCCAPRLRCLVRVGTGLDSVDLEATTERGIRVTALPGLNAEAVAEYTFAMLLCAARRLGEADRSVRRGEWGRFTGTQVTGRTLGLVGFGAIPQAMLPLALGFGMSVIAHRRREGQPATDGVRFVSLETLAAESDFISVHVPLTPETRGLIGAREIELMDRVVLVNTARGGVVDESALLDGLESGRISAAALDVFEHEPPRDSPLVSHPRVVLSPHNAARSDQAVTETAKAAVSVLLAELGVREPAATANL